MTDRLGVELQQARAGDAGTPPAPPAEEIARQQQLEAYASAMAELVAHIAHEVNQPLAAIAANANACIRWLGADPANIDEARAAAARIARDARRASEVIAEMRSFLSRAGGPYEPLCVNGLVEEAVASAAAFAARNQVSLHAHHGAGTLPIVARPVALRQALRHLLDNALEACLDVVPDDRAVDVRVSGPERGEVVVVVEDTGRGFPLDAPQRMFEPLFSTKPGRLGLGLAVSRSIIEDHGGRLIATRAEEGLTRFVVTLPVDAEAA